MLGELQSFRRHKGLHCSNSLFCEGPEARSARPGRHSWTTAGTNSAQYTQLCSNGLTAKTRQGRLQSHRLINKGRKNSPVTALSIRSHLLLGKPCKKHWTYCGANKASQYCVYHRAQATKTGCSAAQL